mmetsp:Transcript_21656/g.37287  ORF Transcript_21656/g.37287 Transcript_21656/m.37287 type:complete len:218 (+) Transcript_21656:102-755(+)
METRQIVPAYVSPCMPSWRSSTFINSCKGPRAVLSPQNRKSSRALQMAFFTEPVHNLAEYLNQMLFVAGFAAFAIYGGKVNKPIVAQQKKKQRESEISRQKGNVTTKVEEETDSLQHLGDLPSAMDFASLDRDQTSQRSSTASKSRRKVDFDDEEDELPFPSVPFASSVKNEPSPPSFRSPIPAASLEEVDFETMFRAADERRKQQQKLKEEQSQSD